MRMPNESLLNAKSEPCGAAYRRWEREQTLEREADTLLQRMPRDPDCPIYTERQLARRARSRCVLSIEAVGDVFADAAPSQAALDELWFLASLTPLTRKERLCLRAWMLGWTQCETAARLAAIRQVLGQQEVSRALRCALRKCYDAVGLSFVQFSRHALYRRPSHRKANWREQNCLFCKEAYVWGLGEGRYCSASCREAARRLYRWREEE